MGMGRQMVSVDVVGGNGESFSSLRNRTFNVSRTVNASVGYSQGIGYPTVMDILCKTSNSLYTVLFLNERGKL